MLHVSKYALPALCMTFQEMERVRVKIVPRFDKKRRRMLSSHRHINPILFLDYNLLIDVFQFPLIALPLSCR